MGDLLNPAKSTFAEAVASGVGFPKPGESRTGPVELKTPAQRAAENAPTDDAAAKAEADRVAAEAAAKKEADEAAARETEGNKTEKPDSANPNLRGEETPAELVRPKGMDENTFKGWSKVHKERAAAMSERDTLKAELEKLKAESGKPNTELEAAKKELEAVKATLAEYEGEVSIARVEGTKQFKEQIAKPLKAISSKMESIAKRYDIDPKVLMHAIAEADETKRADLLEEATSDFKRVDQLAVVTAADEYTRKQADADEMRANAAKKLEEIERQTKGDEDRINEQIRGEWSQEANRAWAKYLESTPNVKKVEGATEWNALLDAAGKRAAEVDPNNIDLKVLAEAMGAKEMLPHVISSMTHFQAENKRLSDELKAEKARNTAYIKSAPGAGVGHGGSSTGGNGSTGKKTLAETFPVALRR